MKTAYRRRMDEGESATADAAAAADDLHDAVEEMKDAAKNGGLKEKRFGDIMKDRTAAQVKHAKRKLDAVT